MTQPFNRHVDVPALREIDEDKGEFWVGNPFAFSVSGQNLSMFEHNGLFLNAGRGLGDAPWSFLDVSYVSATDSDGDGRSVTACDITGDGMPELFVRQVGGGPLLIFRNKFPKANWLQVSLRGTESNRFGVGAKLVCEVGGRRLYRELYPIVNFLSQSPALVHFGLGQSEKIDRLEIRWPSGNVQELTDLPVNQHVLIREDASEAQTVVPGQAGLLVAERP